MIASSSCTRLYRAQLSPLRRSHVQDRSVIVLYVSPFTFSRLPVAVFRDIKVAYLSTYADDAKSLRVMPAFDSYISSPTPRHYRAFACSRLIPFSWLRWNLGINCTKVLVIPNRLHVLRELTGSRDCPVICHSTDVNYQGIS